MSEFLFPFADESQGYGYSPEDRAAIELLCNAVADTKIYAGHEPYDGIATDTLVDLNDRQ